MYFYLVVTRYYPVPVTFCVKFKIKNNMVPDYQRDLFPGSAENPQYSLRQQNDCLTLPRRTSLFERSFVSSVIQQWNTLSPVLRNIQSIGVFKRELLRSMFPTRTVPSHVMHGNRLLSIIHARLRNNCSDLKRDLCLNHLSDHDICLHCNIPETSDHSFFHCPIYSNERLQLFRDTRRLHPFNCNILLFGNSAIVFRKHYYYYDYS